MTSRGKEENARLKKNIEDQLNRLLEQMEDLEELKDDLDEEEYEETKADTIEQLEEFEVVLRKMMAGDMTLVDDFSSVQLAIQAAVGKAFKTPEVIRMFAKKQPRLLRQRLAGLQEAGQYRNQAQAVEILQALKKLGEKLSIQEQSFLENNMNQEMARFDAVQNVVDQQTGAAVLRVAGSQISRAEEADDEDW
eukprot:TRINITY_DN8930_c0_g1_i1.p1 TRINITY_DN8930_c0_g1~~TRINITY_DN8930_c0_g1_i1.p1  ORF type:complete len:202 (-),score=78.01 TRINITY_DN8930_c0_g1_i1:344-922(-)